jgi:hypothetical protein
MKKDVNKGKPKKLGVDALEIAEQSQRSPVEFASFPANLGVDEKTKGEMGIEFTQNDQYNDTITIVVSDIRTAWKHPTVNATIKKLEKFIFEGAELLAVPPDEIANTVTKEEQQAVQSMVESIDGYRMKTPLRMRQAWRDKKLYGSAFFERITGSIPKEEGGKGTALTGPVVFKRLPAYSFDTQPSTMNDLTKYVPGELLKGVVFDLDTFELTYWQRQSMAGDPVQLNTEDIIQVRDESSESPDGESVVATLVPLVRKLNFADQCLMQGVMRVGAPNLDVIIKEYRDQAAPMNADAWDMGKAFSEGKKIGQNWSKSTVLQHPDCIELKPLDWSKMAIDPIKVVGFLNERILYALVPRDFTEVKASTLGQSGSSNLDMLNLWARGEQHEIEGPFLAEWVSILAANKKPGWRVEIVWREMTPDSGAELWNRVRIARDVGVFTPDEIRELVEYPPLTEDQSEEITNMPAKGNNSGGGLGFGGEVPDGTSDDPKMGEGVKEVPGKKSPKYTQKGKTGVKPPVS